MTSKAFQVFVIFTIFLFINEEDERHIKYSLTSDQRYSTFECQLIFLDAKKKSELDFLRHRNLEQHESQSFGTVFNLEIESDISLHEVAQRKQKEKQEGDILHSYSQQVQLL